MKRFILVALAVIALAVPTVASANYIQGVAKYSNGSYANGYTAKLRQKIPCGLGCTFWSTVQTATTGQGGLPGFFSFNVGSNNVNTNFGVTVCGGGYGNGSQVTPGPFNNGTSFAGNIFIYSGVGCGF